VYESAWKCNKIRLKCWNWCWSGAKNFLTGKNNLYKNSLFMSLTKHSNIILKILFFFQLRQTCYLLYFSLILFFKKMLERI